ncbi:hypothetical protein PLESTF_001585500 [Pleodorina starrii]|nr:hypothetical protein PLESTF_001585500 [Pleodorina starrii]
MIETLSAADSGSDDGALGAASGASPQPAVCKRLLSSCNVSNADYNPHVPPATAGSRTWFEGWYLRVTSDGDEDGDGGGGGGGDRKGGTTSFALGIGHFPDQHLPNPSAACFLVVSSASKGAAPRLYTRNFDSLRVESPAPPPPDASGRGRPRNADSSGTCSGGGGGAAAAAADDSAGAVSFALEARSGADGATSGEDFCQWEVTQGSVRVEARLGGARLRLRSTAGACAAADPWDGPEAPAPEGWVAKLGFLLRLRYNVLSLDTPVQYELREGAGSGGEDQNGDGGGGDGADACALVSEAARVDAAKDAGGVLGAAAAEMMTADGVAAADAGPLLSLPPPPRPPRPVVWRGGRLHLEKNWGETFPDQWLWTQGHRSDAAGQASFVLAGGLLPHVLEPLVPPVRMYVLSYHPPPPAARFTVDSRDPPLFSSLTVRGCEGVFSLELYGIHHVVQVVASADPGTFQAIPCPTGSGFRNYSIESFSARVQLRVLRRPYPLAPPAAATLLWEDTFSGAALEFGGGYVCPEAMPQLSNVVGAWGHDGGGGGGGVAAAAARDDSDVAAAAAATEEGERGWEGQEQAVDVQR